MYWLVVIRIVKLVSNPLAREAISKKKSITTSNKLIGYRLCVLASGSLITDIFSFRIFISVSCLHFGQTGEISLKRYLCEFLSEPYSRISGIKSSFPAALPLLFSVVYHFVVSFSYVNSHTKVLYQKKFCS